MGGIPSTPPSAMKKFSTAQPWHMVHTRTKRASEDSSSACVFNVVKRRMEDRTNTKVFLPRPLCDKRLYPPLALPWVRRPLCCET